MRYATFITTVERLSGLPRPRAERAVQAVLRTLAERITAGEARDIAAFLPPELGRYLEMAPEPAEPFDRATFVRRVADREGVDQETAERDALAVFRALGVAVAPGELRDMAAQLPKDFEDLLQAAGVGRRQALTHDDLVGRVAELAALDRDTARRVTEAALETLAVRISAGEVDDLEDELPGDVHGALERGLTESRDAVPMSEQEFVVRVAEKAGLDTAEAERDAHAVFLVLREALSGKEFSDMAAQLSDDYAPLLA